MEAAARTLTPDLAAIKRRQQQTWASGDFHVVGARIVLTAEQLVDAADLCAGWNVLDVATGSGNAAIATARLGCSVVGVDYVPALLERGRRRAAVEGFESAESFVTFFRLWYGPTLKAFAALNDVAGDALETDLIDLVERRDRLGDGAVAVPAAYTEAIAVRR